MGKLFLLFTALPLLDLWVLLRIGGAIGFWNTIALVVATGLAGAWLAKLEGARTPDEGVLSGALVLAGGLLLVSPGVITDALGLVLLFPPTRRVVATALRRWLER